MKALPALLAAAVWSCCDLAGAVPPPPEQSAANCAAPSYASDQLVCADPVLLALDRRMVELLAVVGPSAQAVPLQGVEPQEGWFRRRSLCAFSPRHAACLKAAYRDRIELLSALASSVSAKGPPGVPASCSGAAWGRSPVRLHLGGRAPLLIANGQGRVLLLASPIGPGDNWTPFVRFGMENGAIRLESSEGSAVRCRILPERRPGPVVPSGNPPR